MCLESDLRRLGFKLSRPLSRERYDFAYRAEGLAEASLQIGRALLEEAGIVEEELIKGYWNVKVDLWRLHATRGWPEASCLAVRSGNAFEAILLRAGYLCRLLKPLADTPIGPLDLELRGLLQMIHFPRLHQSAEGDLGQCFWDFTLDRNLAKLPDFTQGQIYSICAGFCECSKTGTCAH